VVSFVNNDVRLCDKKREAIMLVFVVLFLLVGIFAKDLIMEIFPKWAGLTIIYLWGMWGGIGLATWI